MIEPGSVSVGNTVIVKGRGAEFMRKVTKITRTGRIRVDGLEEFQFDPSGNEMGSGSGLYHRKYELYPYDENEALCIVRRNQRRNVQRFCPSLKDNTDERDLILLLANIQGWIDGIKEGRL